jgi:hypothetical protein
MYRLDSGDPMNQNLDLLRQNHCRPAIATGKATNYLFPLEKECEQGKTLLALLPKTLLQLQEFNPYGLHQTYRDESSGLELPLFAVFNLEGKHQLTYEITTDSISGTAEPKSLPSYIPFQTTQASVGEINKERLKLERVATRFSVIVGVIPALAFLFSGVTALPGFAVPCVLVGAWIFGAFLAYVSSLFVLNRFCPWKKLVLTAAFDGILPKVTREKARAAKDHFDGLYLVVDQQQRWKSSLLPDPRPRALDPLLIGELKQGRCRKFFLIHQFDLTEAEQYLADEFATKL